jgi:hypothetical protein
VLVSARQHWKATPCKNSLGECPREGCSKNNDHDPDLNKLKNLKSSTKPVVDRTLTWMIQREQKVENTGYRRGDDREPLTDLDEGSQARVVGYLLAVKQEHGESCNCHLDDVDVTTDNHLVLVNRNVVTDNPLPEHATKSQITAVFKTRKGTDADRFVNAAAALTGKRLTYEELIGKKTEPETSH